jgi:IS5 family transposase
MAFKKTTRNLDFADLAMATCLEQNRSIKLMEQLNNTINWARVESILLSHYTVGTSEEGARAYPPLMLFKCLMLQKWFRIPSDPELENQITDRLSFKTFLRLSFSQPAPDHSTFSRFRSRLPKQAMDAINSEILRQFEQQGLCITEDQKGLCRQGLCRKTQPGLSRPQPNRGWHNAQELHHRQADRL